MRSRRTGRTGALSGTLGAGDGAAVGMLTAATAVGMLTAATAVGMLTAATAVGMLTAATDLVVLGPSVLLSPLPRPRGRGLG